MSKLGDILQEEAIAEINSILTEADSRAATLIREAEKQASERVAGFRKRVETEARAAIRRAKSAAELILATARIQARGQAIALGLKKLPASRITVRSWRHWPKRPGRRLERRRQWSCILMTKLSSERGRFERGSICGPIPDFTLECESWLTAVNAVWRIAFRND
jgi:vacuolar-type H+-ATPase subunit H